MLDDASYGIEALDSFLLSSFDTLIRYPHPLFIAQRVVINVDVKMIVLYLTASVCHIVNSNLNNIIPLQCYFMLYILQHQLFISKSQ